MNIRNLSTKPGFEFIFSVGIAAIFILPAAVMAQSNRNIEVNINNGDTIVNGRNIKSLSPVERDQAMKDINTIKGVRRGDRRMEIHIDRKGDDNDGLGYADNIVKTPDGYIVEDNSKKQLHLKRIMKDTTKYTMKFKFDDGQAMDFRGPDGPGGGMGMAYVPGPPPRMRMRGMEMKRRGSQSFSYSNVDASGVETNVSYRVADKENRMDDGDGPEVSPLPLTDLKLIADFTTGKTQLTFSLPTKAPATAELTDGNGAVVFKDKVAGGSFNKSIAMPLNGHYNLVVKQGGKTASKVIFKQD
ncbi:hypothetical protein [Mucilaginibacter agri]|uniref:Uncharacterized protein n=1 Tax=Mucilaginibacter agri TaxID=2695265 RepID=A0A965ZH55_9SPHI|nr:hypothetical protein [Mucilaginibacter agri]NCD69646.1 hypothetical protein [Mucilaginibacter agri]